MEEEFNKSLTKVELNKFNEFKFKWKDLSVEVIHIIHILKVTKELKFTT
jgi:hypothetical protein